MLAVVDVFELIEPGDGNDDTGWSSDLGPGRRNEESTFVVAAEKPLTKGEAVTFKVGK